METIELAQVVIHYDSPETRRVYERIENSPPDVCTCDACQNWNACGIASLPSVFLELLDTLGINANYPAEVYHVVRIEPGLHVYAGWFHFVGFLDPPGGNEPGSLVFDSCGVVFHDKVQLASERFGTLALTQLEFSANAPWVRSTPEPD
jgi:hypothetical protein